MGRVAPRMIPILRIRKVRDQWEIWARRENARAIRLRRIRGRYGNLDNNFRIIRDPTKIPNRNHQDTEY